MKSGGNSDLLVDSVEPASVCVSNTGDLIDFITDHDSFSLGEGIAGLCSASETADSLMTKLLARPDLLNALTRSRENDGAQISFDSDNSKNLSLPIMPIAVVLGFLFKLIPFDKFKLLCDMLYRAVLSERDADDTTEDQDKRSDRVTNIVLQGAVEMLPPQFRALATFLNK